MVDYVKATFPPDISRKISIDNQSGMWEKGKMQTFDVEWVDETGMHRGFTSAETLGEAMKLLGIGMDQSEFHMLYYATEVTVRARSKK